MTSFSSQTIFERAAARRDEEDARLVSGAADILAAIAAAFGLAALIGIASGGGLLVAAVGGAGLCGLLARWLVDKRGYAASAIVLAIGFALCVAMLFAFLEMFVGIAVGAAMAWFWHRYRVPIAGALTLAAPVASLILGGTNVFDLQLEAANAWRALLAGAILFAGAMAVDVRDTTRTTRVSGIAFWLHIFAAPCLAHGLFSVLGVAPQARSAIDAPVVLAVVAVFALVALIIDRRPLLASSIGYLVYALIALGKDLPIETQLITVTLTIGLGILLMAAAWSPLRRALLKLLPPAVRTRVPDAGSFIPPEAVVDEEAARDGEPVRLVSGFNDIFVAMGSAPVFIGSWILGGVLAVKGGLFPAKPVTAALLCTLIPAATTWAVAEFFVRLRRMALPAVVLAIYFNIVAWGLAAIFALWSLGLDVPRDAWEQKWAGVPIAITVVTCLAAAALNLVFGWRHRIPFAAMLAMSSLLPLAFADLLARTAPEWGSAALRVLAFGLLALGAALALDATDRKRATQRSDIAFWLHMLAACAIVPIAFMKLPAGAALVAVATALLLVIALFALLTDRRAALIVGLPCYAMALGSGGKGLPSGPIMVIVLCGAVLWAVLNWQALRGRALRLIGLKAAAPAQ